VVVIGDPPVRRYRRPPWRSRRRQPQVTRLGLSHVWARQPEAGEFRARSLAVLA